MLTYFTIRLLANHEFSFFKAKITSLMVSNFSYYISKKLIRKNLDIYKLIAEENLLLQYSKMFVIRKTLLLVT